MRSAQFALDEADHGLQAFARRQIWRALGAILLLGVGFALASLGTWNVADPSFSHATANPVTNAMGYPGAVFSDLAMQFLGLASVAALVPAVVWGLFLVGAHGIDKMPKRAGMWLGAALLGAAIAGCIAPPKTWPLPSGLGGVMGDIMLKLPSLFIGHYPTGMVASMLIALLAGPALWAFAYGSGLLARDSEAAAISPKAARRKPEPEAEFSEDDEDDDSSESMLALGALTHWWLSARSFVRRRFARPTAQSAYYHDDGDEADFPAPVTRGLSRTGDIRIEPEFSAQQVREPVLQDEGQYDDELDEDIMPATEMARRLAPATANNAARVVAPASRPVQGARIQREAQASLIGTSTFEMPSLHFLAEPKNVVRDASLSKESLEQNARLLEGVLEDFGVKGEIIHVRPGPVVTLYELEPAPGIKSSRVIGLSDDIARSMSAIACRVAVVPGRNAIGIELPNAKRETVYLREILASRDFETTKAKLALALGKTINGEAVIVDIAKMPHVLVAGTTGSGKSVAINTMILSLLYRMTPEECRLIMIDPKMLELSVYDGIPHLLTPVVTDPKKAVVALKWTVREMEDRYRKMSKVGVRNIEGFNQRVAQAEAKGERISRTVQTGFDRESGEAIYETEALDLERMPFIVVIIDEMADLMMVAGKDIEGAVQRLAQMARAAGIHVIMATQRPSVDVITGTIKANFPTRISFQVTSKIDSRTILGEQGAEQLLGMGDMLYMAGGGRIQRVHGPFVADDEVEKIVAHLKLQGVPEYLDAITEDDGEDDAASDSGRGNGGSGGGNFEDSDDPYDQAVSVVLRDGKASTSYIQRRLGIGYNRAASIIEKMEQEGIVGPANHAGKREILVPTEDDKF
ncbi:cell division protein FtsK [Mesorhizobium sp. NBSH29]|uniref:FtsK/SpoIIIE family DNA translocase n=1 Tax=Mesorhizobium sp. NBSH29 TaxID=2654249 RepID=UPI0018965B0F|nr:DNA translocase FtsK [Mesorhizobium sp. NBSH29]QPC86059.1 cell division protein FtsK [Mesorhizobium sp. NBSH29]